MQNSTSGPQSMDMVNFRGQEVKCQGHRRPNWGLGGVIILDSMGRVGFLVSF